MKPLLLFLAALPLAAQEPVVPPPAQPVEKSEPAQESPELPAKAPANRDDKMLELLRKNPTPDGKREDSLKVPDASKKDEPKKDAFGLSTKRAEEDTVRPRGRNTLLPPVTSTDLELRIRYRKARTVAERDPAVVAAFEASRVAKTDYAKREALKTYYSLIRNKVLALDRGVAPVLDERHSYSMRRLEQNRVEPTDPTEEDLRQRY
jgi:hypothetical protein